MKAYHFLKADFTAGQGNEKPWEIGETRVIPETQRGEIELCAYGYHFSPTLFDALMYAPGPLACLVEVPDDTNISKEEFPKGVSYQRTLLKAVNIDIELRLFTADCAERVLYIFEREYPNDDRPRKAIQATRDYANGKISAAARDAAWAAAGDAAGAAAGAAAWAAAGDAAWAAAGDAAGDAAWAAARDAARDAAWAAARAAAWAAAWAAARDAAWAAAWAAAGDAAWAAAWAAEKTWQRRRFAEMFEASSRCRTMASKFDFDTMHAVLNDDQKAGSLYMAAKQLLDALDTYAQTNLNRRSYVWGDVKIQMSALRNALNLPREEVTP